MDCRFHLLGGSCQEQASLPPPQPAPLSTQVPPRPSGCSTPAPIYRICMLRGVSESRNRPGCGWEQELRLTDLPGARVVESARVKAEASGTPSSSLSWSLFCSLSYTPAPHQHIVCAVTCAHRNKYMPRHACRFPYMHTHRPSHTKTLILRP